MFQSIACNAKAKGIACVGIVIYDGLDGIAQFDGLVDRTGCLVQCEGRDKKIRQIISDMGRLVISYILPRDTHALGVVVHEGRYAKPSRKIRGENIQGLAVIAAPEDNLFTPVSKEVGL